MKSTFFKYLTFALVVGIAFVACKKNNFIVDKDALIPGDGAHFVVKPAISTVANAVVPFAISADPTPGTVYKIPVGLTNVSNVDRVVNFSYTSRTAVNGTQYNAPATLTIKAGTALDTLRIQGLFSGYATPGRKDTLKIKIAAAAGGIANIGYQDSISLVLQKFCPLNMADFAGDFTVVQDGWEDYFPGDVVTLSVSGNNIIFDYPTPYNHNSLNIVVSQTPPFSTSVANTAIGSYSPTGTIYSAKSVADAGNVVSPCDGTISVLLNFTSPAGSYGNFPLKLKKN
jgi:hypothetical protein